MLTSGVQSHCWLKMVKRRRTNMRAAAKGRTCLVLADELQEVQDSKKLGQAVVVNVLGKLAQNKGIVVI